MPMAMPNPMFTGDTRRRKPVAASDSLIASFNIVRINLFQEFSFFFFLMPSVHHRLIVNRTVSVFLLVVKDE